MGSVLPPGQRAIDLDVQGHAEDPSDQNDGAQDGHTAQACFHDDGAHDVGDDEHLEGDEDDSSEVAAEPPVVLVVEPTGQQCPGIAAVRRRRRAS